MKASAVLAVYLTCMEHIDMRLSFAGFVVKKLSKLLPYNDIFMQLLATVSTLRFFSIVLTQSNGY